MNLYNGEVLILNSDLSMTATIISIISVLVSVVSVYDAQYNNKQSVERDKLKESILAVNIFLNLLRNYRHKMTVNRNDSEKLSDYSFQFLSVINLWVLLYIDSGLVDNKVIRQALGRELKDINSDFKLIIKYYRKRRPKYMSHYIEMLKHFNYNNNERSDY